MKSPSIFGFIRGRQLEGTYPGDPREGVWVITTNRIHFGWGFPPDGAWESTGSTESFFDPEPSNIDKLAKPNRVEFYQRVRSSRECRSILDRHGLEVRFRGGIPEVLLPTKSRSHQNDKYGVVASFAITEDFKSLKSLHVKLPAVSLPSIGSHAFGLMANLEQEQSFFLHNSWGRNWGVKGTALIPYEFFDKFQIETYVSNFRRFKPPRSRSSIQLLDWRRNDCLNRVFFGFELYHSQLDERIGWCFAMRREGFLDIEELFVKPAFRRKGFGCRLADAVSNLATSLNLPVRLWVSFVDASPRNTTALIAICNRLGLGLQNTQISWAAYMAIPGKTDFSTLLDPKIPPVPASARTPQTPEQAEFVERHLYEYASSITPSRDDLRHMRENFPAPTIEYDDEEVL